MGLTCELKVVGYKEFGLANNLSVLNFEKLRIFSSKTERKEEKRVLVLREWRSTLD